MTLDEQYSKELEDINELLRKHGVLFRLRETITGGASEQQLTMLKRIHAHFKASLENA